jgi:hypothetical protein
MTQNEILAMLHKVIAENQQFTTWTVSTPHLVALVNQAVEQEREECALICENYADVDTYQDGIIQDYHSHLIRLRGKE